MGSTAEVRIGVLASGSGTNFQAMLDTDLSPGRIVLLLSNRPQARAIDRAKSANVETCVLDHRTFEGRAAFDAAAVKALQAAKVDWVVFAGFMRIVTPVFLDAFKARVINVHPALLPAFPGVDAQKQALEANVKITGCTVHLVDAGVDSGPILAQSAVPVLPEDTVEQLSRRILKKEHALLPAVVRAVCQGRLKYNARGPYLEGLGDDVQAS